MINVNQVASQLARMPDQALQQFAAMHKDDPYTLSMALSESNRRKDMRAGAQAQGGEQPKVVDQIIQGMGPEQAPQQPMPQEPQAPQPAQAGRQLPEEQGIGALPAPNMQGMADGGIVGYASRGAVKAEDPLAQYEPMIRAEAARQGIDPEVAMLLFRQESAGDKKAIGPKTRKTGEQAVGLGQLMEAAAKEMGIKPEERKDPAKNIQASIGYFKKQLNRFGTYEKAAAAYNWGPGNMETHIANSIKDNKDFRVGLPKETTGYLTKVVPPAVAGPANIAYQEQLTKGSSTAPAVSGGDASVPGSPADIAYQAQLKAARGPEKSYLEQRGQELLGAPEAALSLATGAVSPATGAVRAGIDRLLGGKMSVEEGAGRMTYAPRFEAGQESLSQAQRALEDFKIPPYIPGVATSRSRPRAPEAIRAAEAAAETAAQKAAKVEPLRLEPPKPAPKPGVTPESAALGEQAKLQRRQQALVQDRQAAMEAQRQAGRAGSEANTQRTLDLIDRRYDAEQAARGAIASKALPAAAVGANVKPFSEPEVPPVSDVYPDEMLRGVKPSVAVADLPVAEVPIEERSRVEQKAEAKKGTGLSDEDMLMLGLNLMAGKSQYALSNLGEAGIATLGAKREREKLAADKEQRDIMGEYYKRLSGTLGTSAEERMIAQVMKEEGIPYAAAIERISGAKYAPRAETTERDFMKQYEALAKSSPVFLMDNPDAAAWVQNQMRMRGLTTSGSANLASGARFVGFEGQQ